MISIHTPHAGSDIFVVLVHFRNSPFQSTLPMRGATDDCHCGAAAGEFHSTLPMRGATFPAYQGSFLFSYFNPHSPCGERPGSDFPPTSLLDISIHTPHAGSDHVGGVILYSPLLFQSTLPMRGATDIDKEIARLIGISIHTPHAGSDAWSWVPKQSMSKDFNPHSPCGERLKYAVYRCVLFLFQSTLPMRGATAKVTEFTLNLKTKFMTFGTKTNCETLQSSVSRICSNEKNYISQVRISKQFMIASHSHIYKISGSSGIYDALFPKCSTFF